MLEDAENLDLFATPVEADGAADDDTGTGAPPEDAVVRAPRAGADGPRRPRSRGPHEAVAPDDLWAGSPEPEAGAAPQQGPGRPAADEGRTVWSVSQVNRGVRTLLEGTFPQIWVGGEVGRWTRHRSGHRYFTLKDERAQLRCVMFQSDASRLPMEPDEGMTVRVFGSLTLYEARGSYQLTVRRLESESAEGLWRLAFERLRVRLDREGLLAPERKRRLPPFPTAVGVVTSPTGAALRDVLTVVGRRAPWTRVVVRGARVQGDGSAADVAGAIEALGGSGLVDVVIVARGGGSIEDLWAFNEETVARAIAACPVPVISGVGHEVDVTIADLVADHRAPTPSAAAEAAVPDGAALREAMVVTRARLARGLRAGVERRSTRVRQHMAHLGRAARRLLVPRHQALRFNEQRLHAAMRRLTGPRRATVDAAAARLDRALGVLLDDRRRSLATVAARMKALSPLATLARGYAVPLDTEGRLLKGVDAFREGSRFDLRVVDGRVGCEVRDVNRIEDGIGRDAG